MNTYFARLENNLLTIYIIKKQKDTDTTAIEAMRSNRELKSFLDDNKLQYKTIQIATGIQNMNNIPNYLFVKDKDYFRKIYFDQILWIEAAGSYCYMHVNENSKKICVSFTLSEILLQLPKDLFIQTHRSYVVNINHIDSFIGNTICVGPHKIPISKKIRSTIIKRLNVLGKVGL